MAKLRIIPLGGLGEIGKNMTAFEYGDDIFLVDCGATFPDDELMGVDLVIPDMTYLIKNKNVVMRRESILESVWGYDYTGDIRTIDTLIKQLRKKIHPYEHYIRSVYGVGYVFEAETGE